jgi:hypothetical protein
MKNKKKEKTSTSCAEEGLSGHHCNSLKIPSSTELSACLGVGRPVDPSNAAADMLHPISTGKCQCRGEEK